MKKAITILVTATAVLLSGCSTIVFTNDSQPGADRYDLWHHNVAYSLYEISEPVAPNRYCDQGWSEVLVEKDILTALAGGIDNAVGVDLWDPWAVSIRCAR